MCLCFIMLYPLARLLRREISCLEPPRSGFTYLGSIPGLGKTMNVPVFYHVMICKYGKLGII